MSSKNSTLIGLLKSKNRCLERFLALGDEFLPAAVAGDFSQLSEFQARRDDVLKAIDLYDRKIAEAVSAADGAETDPALAATVRACLAEREGLVARIIIEDGKIISLIERERDQIQAALSESRRNRAAADKIKKFKSGWVPESGEGLDEKL